MYPQGGGATTEGALRARSGSRKIAAMTRLAKVSSVLVLAVSAAWAGPSPGRTDPSDTPVKVVISVSPDAVAAGAEAAVTVKLEPKSGIKLNRYPKIKLQIPAAEGLASAAEGSMGNPGPPPPDKLEANYYHGTVDPLVVKVHLEASASKGRHELAGKLSYFYCVAASGYCAPAKVDVSIPVTVR